MQSWYSYWIERDNILWIRCYWIIQRVAYNGRDRERQLSSIEILFGQFYSCEKNEQFFICSEETRSLCCALRQLKIYKCTRAKSYIRVLPDWRVPWAIIAIAFRYVLPIPLCWLKLTAISIISSAPWKHTNLFDCRQSTIICLNTNEWKKNSSKKSWLTENVGDMYSFFSKCGNTNYFVPRAPHWPQWPLSTTNITYIEHDKHVAATIYTF